MSLKTFHIFFISVCAVLSLFMAFWGFHDYRVSGGMTGLGVGLTGTAGLLALLPYFRWFQKKFRKIALGSALALPMSWLALVPSAEACTVCFGDPDSLMTKGLKTGILLLVVVIAVVLGGIAAVAITWSRRAKALNQ